MKNNRNQLEQVVDDRVGRKNLLQADATYESRSLLDIELFIAQE